MAAFPKFTRAEANANNAACRIAALIAQALGLDLAATKVPHDGATIELGLTVDSADYRVLAPVSLANTIASRFLSLTTDYTIPEELLPAVLEATLAAGLAEIERVIGASVKFQRLTRREEPAWPSEILLLHLRSLGSRAVIGIISPPLSVSSPHPSSLWIDEKYLSLRLAIVVGAVPLTTADLRNLAIGDVVLLPATQHEEGLHVYLSLSDRHAIQASINGDQLTVLNKGNLMSTEVSEPGEEAQATTTSAPAVSIDDVTLKVIFDLGEIELSVPEVRALVPGQTIDLGRLPAQAVRVSVNGRRIGTGEIVEIEGRLGVRLLELVGRHEYQVA